jgi:hypothetical protein
VPFFGAFDVAWDEAMVARCSANPLGMLGPELGARMAANGTVAQDPAGTSSPPRTRALSTERIDGIVTTIGRALVAQEQPQPEYSLFFV